MDQKLKLWSMIHMQFDQHQIGQPRPPRGHVLLSSDHSWLHSASSEAPAWRVTKPGEQDHAPPALIWIHCARCDFCTKTFLLRIERITVSIPTLQVGRSTCCVCFCRRRVHGPLPLPPASVVVSTASTAKARCVMALMRTTSSLPGTLQNTATAACELSACCYGSRGFPATELWGSGLDFERCIAPSSVCQILPRPALSRCPALSCGELFLPSVSKKHPIPGHGFNPGVPPSPQFTHVTLTI